ncbi:amino acid ABC transporter permease [Limobrevibacterium gyesilva]|uniref:Amino acid ABC transporter permease n=1 Tax=Limobrevibacterium gyesilva TaxID=2991712 RepID=A0AA41YPG4_9PROT|nr:amino acid ABC transporter permease [Limobrevibacterium gyesilva]MCW3476122.1 amino acid ABC transporter permease [Limobrevibacterium gyesilva]
MRHPLVRALFGTKLNAAITLLMLAAFALVLPPLFRWAIGTAVWNAPNRAGCEAADTGACWAFIRARLALFFYGIYPVDQRWRVDAGLVVLVVIGTGALFARRHRGLWLLALAVLIPVIDGILLVGGIFGLELVPTGQWGGLMLNVVISFVALGGSIPLGIALAFGRRSKYPVIRYGSIAMIEFWRGVPLLAVLFMGLILLPLFLPNGVNIDNLVRALVVLTLFTSAYMAEIVRGGLQGVQSGQPEAALALGMHTAQVQLLVVLPQALRLSIPGFINIAVDLFKDTTLVSIVGLFDLMGVVNQSLKDTAWTGLAAEGYTFAALVFFFACLIISLGGSVLERHFAIAPGSTKH